eukprot:Rmarinus@m.19388
MMSNEKHKYPKPFHPQECRLQNLTQDCTEMFCRLCVASQSLPAYLYKYFADFRESGPSLSAYATDVYSHQGAANAAQQLGALDFADESKMKANIREFAALLGKCIPLGTCDVISPETCVGSMEDANGILIGSKSLDRRRRRELELPLLVSQFRPLHLVEKQSSQTLYPWEAPISMAAEVHATSIEEACILARVLAAKLYHQTGHDATIDGYPVILALAHTPRACTLELLVPLWPNVVPPGGERGTPKSSHDVAAWGYFEIFRTDWTPTSIAPALATILEAVRVVVSLGYPKLPLQEPHSWVVTGDRRVMEGLPSLWRCADAVCSDLRIPDGMKSAAQARTYRIRNTWYKLYDHTQDSEEEDCLPRRLAGSYAEDLQTMTRMMAACGLQDVCTTFLTQDVAVVKCTHVEGATSAIWAHQFASVYQKLRILHNAGYAHGDVRECNMVFGELESWLLDFDMMGWDERTSYVSRYNADPSLGRHPRAKPCAMMTRDHDLYALAGAMEQYVPVNDEHVPTWRQCCDRVRSGMPVIHAQNIKLRIRD